MGTVIKDLVTAGHALSNEMTGAPSALVRELASRLDVQRVCHEKAREVTNCPQGVELQEHLKQLVAESVALKPKAWYIRTTDEVTTDPAEAKMWRGIPLVMANIETPATDSILREAEARGVDKAIEHLLTKFSCTGHVGVPAMALEYLAEQLREGKA